MPASLPNLSSIHTMGAQFKNNIFSGASRAGFANASRLNKVAAKTPASNVQMPAQPEKTFSPAGPNDAPLSENAVAEGRARRQAKAGYSPPSASHAAPDFGPGNIARGHALERGPVPSTHAAPSFQVNTMTTPSRPVHAAPSFSAPTNTQPQQFSGGSERVDVSTKDNSPFPTHVHPENSSNLELHDLSRKISSPDRPNSVTLGSRNIKGGGIASMGSQLEESIRTKPMTLPPKRKRI